MSFVKRFLLSITALSFVSAACGSSSGGSSSNAKFDGKEYIVLSGEDLTQSENQLSGTGAVVFNAPLVGGMESGQHVHLKGSIEDGGVLTLKMYADNKLYSGTDIVFSRSGSALAVSLQQEAVLQNVSSSFATMDASQELDIRLDVHNDEATTHVVFWNGAEPNPTAENPVLSYEDLPAKGQGAFWGVTLSKAAITQATLEEPKFEE